MKWDAPIQLACGVSCLLLFACSPHSTLPPSKGRATAEEERGSHPTEMPTAERSSSSTQDARAREEAPPVEASTEKALTPELAVYVLDQAYAPLMTSVETCPEVELHKGLLYLPHGSFTGELYAFAEERAPLEDCLKGLPKGERKHLVEEVHRDVRQLEAVEDGRYRQITRREDGWRSLHLKMPPLFAPNDLIESGVTEAGMRYFTINPKTSKTPEEWKFIPLVLVEADAFVGPLWPIAWTEQGRVVLAPR